MNPTNPLDNIPLYSPGQLVRLELLAYGNPEGLHPVEQNWRDLARDLLQHVQALQTKLEEVKPKVRFDDILQAWSPMKFPKPYNPMV